MKLPFTVRYASNKVFWFFAKPINKRYRHIFRPTLRGVKVLIVNNDKVLLVRPNYAHRKWTFPGGGVGRSETFETAAVRETKEETGLEIGGLSVLGEYETRRDGCRNIVRTFMAHTNVENIRIDGIEIAEAAWFPLTALPAQMTDRARRTIDQYLATQRAQ